MRVTEAELKKLQEKGLQVVPRGGAKIIGTMATEKEIQEHPNHESVFAKEKKPRRAKKPNKTERTYALQLEALKQAGEIAHYGFEEVTLKLADGTRYTPDFFVVKEVRLLNQELGHSLPYYLFEFHEVKGGHIWDDSKVKFKVARKMFPWFKFKMLQYKDKMWNEIYPE